MWNLPEERNKLMEIRKKRLTPVLMAKTANKGIKQKFCEIQHFLGAGVIMDFVRKNPYWFKLAYSRTWADKLRSITGKFNSVQFVLIKNYNLYLF